MADIDLNSFLSTDGIVRITDVVLRKLCDEEKYNGVLWYLVDRYIDELQKLNVREQVDLLAPGVVEAVEESNKEILGDAELN